MNWPARFGNSPVVAATRLTILCLSLFLFAYMAVRAARVAFTYDEATTYLDTIASGPLAAFTFDSANNHFLNSLLTKLVSLAGSSEFILRVPNLLAFAVYLLFSFLILDRFIKRPAIISAGFILLVANPYTLDFFSLCRGYGLSLAFLMASLYFFFIFQQRAVRREPGGHRNLRYSLAAASLAVLANFTLIHIYLGLCAIALGLFAVLNLALRDQKAQPLAKNGPRSRPIPGRAAVVIALIVFNAVVISQDSPLVGKLFRPVTVSIPGLDAADRERVGALSLSPGKPAVALKRRGDRWLEPETVYVSAIRLSAPPDVWGRIRHVEVAVGSKTISFPRAYLRRAFRSQRGETSVAFTNAVVFLERSLLPGYRRAINWAGDLAFLRVLLIRLLFLSGIGILAAALAWGVGSVLGRRRLLAPAQFWLPAGSALTLAALIGYPLYILRRNGELYWGGRSGFIRDTVLSLIRDSFYGRNYSRGQEGAVLALVGAILLASVIGLVVARRHWHSIELLPGLILMLLLALTWASTAFEHALFHEPYPLGRTGLFCLPIFVLLVIFLMKYLSGPRKATGTAAVAVLLVLAGLSAGHFAGCLNTSMTQEWRMDADVKKMLRDLEILESRDYPPHARLSLGAEWFYSAPLRYYQRWKEFAWLAVRPAPPYEDFDFFFTQGSRLPQPVPPRLTILATYRRSGAVLAKVNPQ